MKWINEILGHGLYMHAEMGQDPILWSGDIRVKTRGAPAYSGVQNKSSEQTGFTCGSISWRQMPISHTSAIVTENTVKHVHNSES